MLDGIEATRLMAAGKATRDARVIAHTAQARQCSNPFATTM